MVTLGDTDRQGTFHAAFNASTSVQVLMLQPNDANGANSSDDAPAAAALATNAATCATIIKAFNEQNQFPAVTKIWATDDIIMELKGRFAAYDQFKDVPRALRAAPDAKTWAGVQLWLWWLPPTSFSRGSSSNNNEHRVVCKSRLATIWTTMLAGFHAEKSATLPRLPEELWLYMFGFLKHDEQPIFPT